MERLKGKVAIITGAGRGMGAAHARLFIEEGAKVILTDIVEGDAAVLAKELGENALFLKHDVGNFDSWQQVIKEAEAKFGTINVLVNNAGILGEWIEGLDQDEEDYLNVININQNSVYYGMKAILPSMRKSGKGSIVNISSVVGTTAARGVPNIGYVASKFAVKGLTRAAAAVYGQYNIRVNSVQPGYTNTQMTETNPDSHQEDPYGWLPLRRVAEPKEVSYLIVFLASDESSYITAGEYAIDGGMTV